MARGRTIDEGTGLPDAPEPVAPPPALPPEIDAPVRGGPAGVGGSDTGTGEPRPAPPTLPPTGAGQTEPTDAADSDADTMDNDQVGDIPPPPVPDAPAAPLIQGPGVAGIPGTEAGTFARPGTRGATAFRSPAFVPKRPPRFGPGVANVGGGQSPIDVGLGLSPDEAAELLASIVGGRGGF